MSEGTGTEQWRPTKEFYQSNAKAEDIREACIPILQKLNKLLYSPEVSDNPEEKSKLNTGLEIDNGALIELGITSDMAAGKSIQEYQNSPLLTAQYFAGQLIVELSKDLGSETEGVSASGEFSKKTNDIARIVEIKNLPRQTRDFMAQSTIFGFIKDGFAVTNEELGVL